MIMTLQEVMDVCPDWDKFCDLKGFNPYAVNEGGGHCTVNLHPYEAHILGIVTLSEDNILKYTKECPDCRLRSPKLYEVCPLCGHSFIKKTSG